jgi:hypothetical protein
MDRPARDALIPSCRYVPVSNPPSHLALRFGLLFQVVRTLPSDLAPHPPAIRDFVPRSPRSPFPPKRLTLGKQSKSMASFPTHDPHQLSIVRKVLSVLPASPRRGVIGVRRDHRRARTSSGAVSSALLRGPRRGLIRGTDEATPVCGGARFGRESGGAQAAWASGQGTSGAELLSGGGPICSRLKHRRGEVMPGGARFGSPSGEAEAAWSSGHGAELLSSGGEQHGAVKEFVSHAKQPTFPSTSAARMAAARPRQAAWDGALCTSKSLRRNTPWHAMSQGVIFPSV